MVFAKKSLNISINFFSSDWFYRRFFNMKGIFMKYILHFTALATLHALYTKVFPFYQVNESEEDWPAAANHFIYAF